MKSSETGPLDLSVSGHQARPFAAASEQATGTTALQNHLSGDTPDLNLVFI